MTASVMALLNRQIRRPLAARLFLSLLERIKAGTVVLTTPDGETIRYSASPEPYVEFHIHDWNACRLIMQSGDIGFAEAYRDRKYSCNDIVAALSLAIVNQDIMAQTIHGTFIGTLLYRLKHLLNRNTRAGSQKNIHLHYDIGNPFYQLWLDPGMTYSAAVFESPDQSLEQAQLAKYERLLRLINAQAGQHILEIGCGWGGFAEYAARSRGCRVTGISLSQEQLRYARKRVANTDLAALTEFRYCDYRDINGQYDAVVSVEMFEAVGESYWPSYFSKLRQVLRPGGRIALQTITIGDEFFEDYRRQTDFIQQYIFPGGMLPSPARIKEEIAHAGLSLRDSYDFGLDYAETLRRWRRQFDGTREAVLGQGFDEAFVRLWHFYLAYCEAGFVNRRTSVCQLLLEHGE